MAEDRFGLPFTATSEEVADQVRAGSDQLLRLDLAGIDPLRAAAAEDPACVLAQVFLSVFLGMEGDPEGAEQAGRAAVEAAADATDRERSLTELFFGGDGPEHALTRFRSHLERWPGDVLVHFVGQRFGPATIGVSRERFERFVDARNVLGDDPVYLAHLAMRLQDVGRLDEAEEAASTSLDADPDNVQVAHALAHVFHERGQTDAGVTFIDDWLAAHGKPSMVFVPHLSWHASLLEWVDGDLDAAMQRHRCVTELLPVDEPLRVIDGASFCWRQFLYGDGHPNWSAVEEAARSVVSSGGPPVVVWNAALWAAAADRDDDLHTVATWKGWGDPEAGLPLPAMARAVCDGLRAFARGEDDECVALLEPILDDLRLIGGSHAQREVIEETCIRASMRSTDPGFARRRLQERLRRRAWARDQEWLATLQT